MAVDSAVVAFLLLCLAYAFWGFLSGDNLVLLLALGIPFFKWTGIDDAGY